ncbi:MAG: 2-C-methyl-D-erythritol 4-phosphate cytidylyltransferase [Bacteroidales bacterium]|nr:2-C-methyl-D-erythritol 4-phosphate cytidylyltransferase [Bacteroidales bacterium]
MQQNLKENIAIIVSGGSGKRMNSQIPKQYIKVKNRTILEYCLDKFINHEKINHIIIVVHDDYIDKVKTIIKNLNTNKNIEIAKAGEQRYDSVYAGLLAANSINPNANVLIHDAVRPNLNSQIIDELIEALEEHDAACPVLPIADTVLELNENGLVNPLNRNNIKLVQTPQAFHFDKIMFSYNEFLKQTNFTPTDDTSIYLRYAFNPDITLTNGSADNYKITWPEDLKRFEQDL